MPYANRTSNSLGQISFDIRTHIPPAARPSTATVQGDGMTLLWETFERCWNLDWALRPSAQALCDDLSKYETAIINAPENEAQDNGAHST